MIDIHCHLIPGIDDGPPDIASSLALARALVADGVRHVVCTPHVFPGRFENRQQNIQDELELLRQHLRDAGIRLTVSAGGEVRLTPEVLPLLAVQQLPSLGYHGTMKAMLIEMPDGQVPVGAQRFMDKLLDSGIRPIIAHPERNRAVIDDPEVIADFVDMGCLLQLTASSVTGHFGSRAQRTARALLDDGGVVAVASDAHNLGGRQPRMTAAAAWLEAHYGKDAAWKLVLEGPASVCQPEPPVKALPAAESWDVLSGHYVNTLPPDGH